MNIVKAHLLCLIAFFMFACSDIKPNRQAHSGNRPDSTLTISQANGFRVAYYGRQKILSVRNPWQGAKNVNYTYQLSPDTIPRPDSVSFKLEIPVKRMVCLSTTHIAMLDVLNVLPSVKGVSGANYVHNKVIRENLKKGNIKDIGFSQNLHYEELISLKPDLLMAYEVEGKTSYVNKLQSLDIPVVFNGDYLENTPLGKAEWIKFIAAFYNKEHMAIKYYQQIKKAYKSLQAKMDTVTNKPTVFTGLPFKGSWYVPGGESYMAHLIEDAGGTYLWSNNSKRESIALSVENVFARAQKADFWLNTGRASTLKDLNSRDTRFKELHAYIKGTVYNNNARITTGGGNDFWEQGTVEPHILLKDLIAILHPEVLPDHDLKYYQKLH